MTDLKDFAVLIVSSGMIGFVLPIVIGIVNKFVKSKSLREVVAVVSSVIVGLLISLSSGQLDGVDSIMSVGIVLVASQQAYEAHWKPRWDRFEKETEKE